MTYYCPFCREKMTHQPSNGSETKDETLTVEVGDTFKCGCSFEETDNDGTVWRLNSWKFEDGGWLRLHLLNPIINGSRFPLVGVNAFWKKENEIPYTTLKEIVQFT
jgi:hypothetical protein